ncbi:MAG: hypothetical protein LUD74_04925 [Tannerellaceae bacterium]|nr:hypothetical protein [Tannerellaceae bacterium]
MNSIGKITIQFHMEEQSFARALYSRWDSFFYTCIEKVLDRVISNHCPVTNLPE